MVAQLSQGVPDPLATPDFINHNHEATTGDDTITGTNFPGLEVFNGKGGDDLFIGLNEDDLFRDGPGKDGFIGGGGFNRVTFFLSGNATEGAYASLATQTIYDDGFGHTETMSGIEGLGSGTLFADTFVGDAGPNMIGGGHGDLLFGGGGDDAMFVFDAPALVDGGAGVNSLVFEGGREAAPDPNAPPLGLEIPLGQQAATHGVVVDLGLGLILDDGFGGHGLIHNIQNVYGSPLSDLIIGDGRDNVLLGLGGDDTLAGGGGNDVFLFDSRTLDFDGNAVSGGHDVILDFHHGHDKIAFNDPAVTSFADLQVSEHGNADVVITYGPDHDTITLLGVHHVTANDFLFGFG
jgi:Ca2+-binding RTX toxin-like protein